jgi:hypothetical protein
VEHGISHLTNWRPPARHLGRRDHLDIILRAVAGLVSSPEQAPRLEPLDRSPQASPPAPPRDQTGPDQATTARR